MKTRPMQLTCTRPKYGSILGVALAIIEQQAERANPKSHTVHLWNPACAFAWPDLHESLNAACQEVPCNGYLPDSDLHGLQAPLHFDWVAVECCGCLVSGIGSFGSTEFDWGGPVMLSVAQQ